MSTLAQARICVQKFPPEDQVAINAIHYGAQSDAHAARLKAALVVKKLWPPNSTVKISFLNNKKVPRTPSNTFGTSVDPLNDKIKDMSSIDAVKTVVKERMEPLMNLKIKYVDKDGDIRISFNENDGAWSTLGTDCFTVKDKNKPTLNLGWIDAPTVIHEFGHALGALIHEHQNPIGGNTIQWDKPKVYKWGKETQGWDPATVDSNVFAPYERSTLNGSAFDPLSIMLYFFPKEFTLNNQGTPINGRLSGYDTIWLNDSYKKGAPETPEQFYPRVYNQSLQSALDATAEARKTYLKEKFCSPSKSIVESQNIFVFVVIIILFFILLLVVNMLKNK
jgi:hypothetical protein